MATNSTLQHRQGPADRPMLRPFYFLVHRRFLKKGLLAFLLMGMAALPALAQTTWTGSTSTDWATAANWSTNSVPTDTDDVVIPNMANDPVIGTGTAALAHSVELRSNAGLTIQSSASLTINGSKNVGGFITAFYNRGNVNNSGVLAIGNTASVGNYGLRNEATFNNNAGGTIQIDRSAIYGLVNAGTFNNAASIVIGANAAVGNDGLHNSTIFNNNAGGTIQIDRSTIYGLYNHTTFTNAGSIIIGANAAVGIFGLDNESTFNNNAGGTIQIDRSTDVGLYSRGTFTNAASIIIGANASVGVEGLDNSTTFNNNAGGTIQIDRTTNIGLNNFDGTFTNRASIIIGANASVGFYGLYNPATFNNSGCSALLKVASNSIIDGNAGFTNSGSVIDNASGNSDIGTNTGIVQNLNGGAFSITNNTGVNTTSAGTLWRGCTSTDWATATNWNTGIVPTATDDAVILNVANDPVISAGTAAVAKTVEVRSSASLTIQSTASLTINGSKNYGSFTAAFHNGGTVNNSGALVIGNTASVGARGLSNTAIFNNNSCATLSVFAPFFNNSSFSNRGLLTVNTTGAHTNTGFTNNGIIVYPQGNPIPNVTNNDLIVAPVSSGCGLSVSPALQIGASNSFTAGTTWYKDAALSIPAGSYTTTTNTFTFNSPAASGTYPLYFVVADSANSCPRTVSVSVTVVGDTTLPVLTCPAGVVACDDPASGNTKTLTLTATDNCTISSTTYAITGATSATGTGGTVTQAFNVGTSTITWTVRDAANNVSTCSTTVTIRSAPAVTISASPTYTVGNCLAYTIYIGYGPQTINLTANASGGTTPYSYAWTPASSVTSPSAATTAVSPAATTVYNVTVTDANGCSASSATGFTVKVKDVRCGNNNNKVMVCHNGTALCISPNAVSAHISNHGDCLGDCTSAFAKSSGAVTHPDLEQGSITVFPNPAKTQINVGLKEMGAAYRSCQITDINGRVVMNKEINGDVHTDVITVDVSTYAPGIYIIRAVTDNGTSLTKFTVE